MAPTPRTDAIAHRGLGSVAYISEMTNFARQLERGLAAANDANVRCSISHMERCSEVRELKANLASERALADRLDDALENSVSWDYAKPAFDAWKEARRGTR